MTDELETQIELIAKGHDLDPRVVRAMVFVESGGDNTAYRPEPGYRYFWNVKSWKPFRQVTNVELVSEFAPKDFPSLAGSKEQEWWAQQASWGVMQVMGAVAREYGCHEPYLTALCRDTSIGLLFGCRVLQRQFVWSKGVVDQALAAYNGGRAGNDKPPYRNAAYIAKVHAAMKV